MATLERMFTVKQLAELLGLAPGTLHNWLSIGVLPRTKIRNRTLIRESAILALIEDGGINERLSEQMKTQHSAQA